MAAVIEKVKDSFMEWVTRSLIAVIAYLAINIHQDVNSLLTKVPVMEQRIKYLEEDNSRNRDKNSLLPIQKQDGISIDNPLKNLK